MEYDPGEKFQYANSASHLLSVILTKATGMSTREFADKFLFRPLDIKSPEWAKDPDGFYTGYANIYLRPLDLAKFGWMYYNRGKWNGVQVVPAEWVEQSTRVQVDFTVGRRDGSGTQNGNAGQSDEENGMLPFFIYNDDAGGNGWNCMKLKNWPKDSRIIYRPYWSDGMKRSGWC